MMKKQSVTKNKPMYMLIALAASILLWIYVVTVVSTEKSETFYNIPVTFTGVDTLREEGLTITSGMDKTVHLKLTGRRTVIQELSSDNIILTIDVSKINTAGEYERSYNITYPNSIQPSNVTVDRRMPSAISFTVSELETREIPVKVAFQGTVADGYMIESAIAAYDAINITGESEKVAGIGYALIIIDDMELTGSFTRNMEFTLVDASGEPVDASGIETEEKMIGVTVNVVKHKDVPLVMQFTPGGGATEANVNWKSNPPTITVSGDEKILDGLNQIVLGTENLGTIIADTTQTYPIVLPDGVKNESGDVEATVTIALTGLSSTSTTVKAANFEFANTPAGYVAKAVTQSLQITVRGPSEEVRSITADKIRVIANLSEISGVAGTYTVNDVEIRLDGYPNCGVLGNYSVMTTLITEADHLSSMAEENADDASGETDVPEGS